MTSVLLVFRQSVVLIVTLLLCAASPFQKGLMEALCRRHTRWRGTDTRSALWRAPAVSMFLGLAGVFVFLVWGMGVHWFYIYQEGYKALFS
jgi:hypothetical protein